MERKSEKVGVTNDRTLKLIPEISSLEFGFFLLEFKF